MIIELIMALSIIIIAVFPAMFLYDYIESDFLKSLIIVAYCILSMGLMFNWFADFIIYKLT